MSVTIKRNTDGTYETYIRNEYPPMEFIMHYLVGIMGYLLKEDGHSITLDAFSKLIEEEGRSRGFTHITLPLCQLIRDVQAKDDPKVELLQMFDDLGNDAKLLNAGKQAFSEVNDKQKKH